MKDCEDQSQVHQTSLKISSRLNFLYLRFRDVFPQKKKILFYIVRTKEHIEKTLKPKYELRSEFLAYSELPPLFD